MNYQYTPAAERALSAAAARLPRSRIELTPPAVLLGLLHEPECRAAKILAAHAIDEPAIVAAWPDADLTPSRSSGGTAAAKPLSGELEAAFHSAILRLDENPRTCQLATEHLLLGLATDSGPVGMWLRERGVDPDAMDAEICARYGIDHSPIPLADVDLGNELFCKVEFHPSDSDPVISDASAPSAPSTFLTTPQTQPDQHLPAGLNLPLARILDAAANRAGEALRVVEDYVRFALDDRALTALCKQMRHDLTAALAPISTQARLAARDTVHDVGTELSTPTEMTRADLADVAAANVRRLQESLRSLEEFGKVLDAAMAARCEQLRYRSYTLQKALSEVSHRPTAGGQSTPRSRHATSQHEASRHAQLRARLAASKLYVLLDGRESESAFVALARSLIAAGVDILQLRDKNLDDRTLLARAHLLRALTHETATRDTTHGDAASNEHRTLFIMNDRPDLALLAAADGVHLGQDELTVSEARRILGNAPLIGVSTHNIDQARQAVTDQADYLGLGPTFPSTTKQFTDFPGLAFLRAAAQEITIPTFAIGGITPENLANVLATGIHRVAMSGGILNSGAPITATLSIIENLSII